MKWMIASLLVGSTAVGGAAIDSSEGMGSGNPTITHEIESNGYFEGEVIYDLAINPTILLDEWDTLSPEQQAEWQNAHDDLVKEAQIAHDIAVREERIKRLDNAIKAVVNQVGKTPYVLSGNTTKGWDCSGLVMWMYYKLSIELPHSASAQRYAGHLVVKPRVGDIVVWGDGYHSGIYIGNGKAVHAYNTSRDTIITRVDDVAGSATFTRVYDY
jgi:cell wall-associated NlpC family hydrolase